VFRRGTTVLSCSTSEKHQSEIYAPFPSTSQNPLVTRHETVTLPLGLAVTVL